MDAKAGTTSNTIEGVYTVSYDCKTQERQQLSIKGARCFKISSRNERMGNTIDFHSSVLRDNTIVILRQLDDRQYNGEQPVQVCSGSNSEVRRCNREVRFAPVSRHRQISRSGPVREESTLKPARSRKGPALRVHQLNAGDLQ